MNNKKCEQQKMRTDDFINCYGLNLLYSEVNGIQVRYLSLDEMLRARDFCFWVEENSRPNGAAYWRKLSSSTNLSFSKELGWLRFRESEWIWEASGVIWIYNETFCLFVGTWHICNLYDLFLTIVYEATSWSRNAVADADLYNFISWLRAD